MLLYIILFALLLLTTARVNQENQTLEETIGTSIFKNITESTLSVYDDPMDKIYGVNIGGWLLTEPWITPSLYDNIYKLFGIMPKDEYSLNLFLGNKELAKEYFQNHWKGFYTEVDFKEISKMGLNLVRIPIGYWAFELLPNDPYCQGQEQYLDLAIGWAEKYGLKVQIGLHGLPGSQNGFDNSGLTTPSPQWLSQDFNIELSHKIIEYIFTKYGSNPTIHSIQVVNEPLGPVLDKKKLVDFYTFCLNLAIVKKISAKLVFHDAFLDMEAWKNFYPGKFILDHHFYEVFTEWQLNLDLNGHLANVQVQGERLSKTGHRSIVGEFSGALTDCTRYLNGIGNGARWDGTYLLGAKGSCQGRDDPTNLKFKHETMVFLKEQFYTYENKGAGWIFWCFKTESSLDWDFKKLYELKMLPVPLYLGRDVSKFEIKSDVPELEVARTNDSISRPSNDRHKSGGNTCKFNPLVVFILLGLAGIKKKSTLRDKSKKTNIASKITQFKHESNDTYHENPMLKLAKISKKEKQQTKTNNFTTKLMNKVTFNTSNNLSKSSIRRKKRRDKEQLKPKMDELFSSLPEVTTTDKATTKIVTSSGTSGGASEGYIKSSKSKLNKPNPTKSTGFTQILKNEHKNFNNVLKNPQFRTSPFDALRNAIQQNMK
ncbi:Glucan 13-beta-glucosidase [Spathaspora sp. JA1]|nr:Glucan 13-beta-glucosidase [Spathaspora sp. JA1]